MKNFLEAMDIKDSLTVEIKLLLTPHGSVPTRCWINGEIMVDENIGAPKFITKQIKLDKDLMMELKYPSLNEFVKSNFDPNDTGRSAMDQSFDLISTCIDKIYNEDEVWAASDCTKKEIKDFLESMNSSQFKQIETFFDTMPKLSHSIKVTNPKTKVESDVVLEGLASFFG